MSPGSASGVGCEACAHAAAATAAIVTSLAIPRIDIVGEFLWGRRIDKDRESAKARQIQFGTIFRF